MRAPSRNVAIAAILGLGLLLSVPFVRTSADTVGSKPLRWILNGPALGTFTTDPAAVKYFANSKPFVMLGKEAPTSFPASWNAVPFRSFSSYAAAATAFSRGTIGSDVKGIMYDNEMWKFTPPEEQRDPATYIKKFADLVHSHGLLFLAAPAANIAKVMDPSADKRYDSYVRLGLAGIAARYADVYDIQAQGSETNVQQFSTFVNAAAQQARAANPSVIVLAGISTNPSGVRVSSDVIMSAIAATRANVDGYWFNVPKPSEYCPKCSEFRPDMAIDVLTRLNATAGN